MGLMDGIIVIDKPRGISSHDAVQRLRKLLGTRRVGHLGTLDPLATGVLPLVVGTATRLAQFFLHHDRAYDAAIRIGFATTTYDSEGEPISTPEPVELQVDEVARALEAFRGRFEQVPPPISAKKISGVPAYKLARKNVEVALEPVEIEVYALDLLGVDRDTLRIRMRCSAGTYVRSLAHDLGRIMGPGGHVTELRRTEVGELDLSLAHTFADLARRKAEATIESAFVDAARLLPEIPAQRVDEAAATRILHGRDFRVLAFSTGPGARRIKAIGPDGRLLAIGELCLPRTYHPIIVF